MVAKILVVEDETQFERLILQRFRRKIRAGTFSFFFAENGRAALAILEKEPDIKIVLSDLNMPEMNGIELITAIHEKYPLIRTVIVSAYGDMENIRSAMNQGAFDFITKPINFADLEATVNKTLEEVEVLAQAKRSEELAIRNEQLEDLDRLKSELFTNIAHEFRTPLTVILGMAEQIKSSPEKWTSTGVDMIHRNGSNLLYLVNEMLDLRKLEAGKIELKLIHGDVIAYIKYIAQSFQALTEQEDILLHFLSSEEELQMDYDPERVLSILSNLLSNAFKYTPAGGHIYLQVDRVLQALSSAESDETPVDSLKIVVRDTGIGMAESDLPHIFDRYYQADINEETLETLGGAKTNRTGIGLALTRELTRFMGGKIEVESKVGKGSTFTLFLPILKEQQAGEVQASTKELVKQIASLSVSTDAIELFSDGTNSKPQLLIVEDNPDILQYISGLLAEDYQLQVAKDGEEGITKALAQIPDIIISDVMMPGKDGFELCETLKLDERTSHIPIVLLTAKADAESRLEGLKRGADAYLSKPFQQEELFIRLNQLLALRQKLQEHFAGQVQSTAITNGSQTDNPLLSDMEDSFLARFHQALETNIEEEDFGITEMCSELAMSRAQLHRKIKALTGLSTSHYMRAIRLQKAKLLLESTDLNISEVAYRVGFRDPKYFSRTYSETFGFAPTDTPKGNG